MSDDEACNCEQARAVTQALTQLLAALMRLGGVADEVRRARAVLAQWGADEQQHEFNITLCSSGKTREAAWENALRNLIDEPGPPPEE